MQINGKLIRGSKINGLLVGVEPTPPEPEPTIRTVWNVQSIYFTFPALTTVSDAVTGVIDWGDGTTSEFESQRPTAHAYEETGTYTITVDCDITGIKDEAFKERDDLSEIELSENIVSIGEYVFSKCTALHTVKLPDNLTTIGPAAFHYTSVLDTVDIPDSVITIGNACFWASGISHVVIPEGITSITSMFDHCYNLVDITLPQTLTNIGSYTFNYCTSLKSIDIPSNVNTILYDAFANTSDITIRIHRTGPPPTGSPWRAVNAQVEWVGA